MSILYVDGRFVKEEDARIGVLDRGFLYGEGLFETLAAFAGRIFRLDRHLSRLWGSAEALDIPLPVTKEQCGQILRDLIEKNSLSDAYLKLVVSSGRAEGMVPQEIGSPGVVGIAKPLAAYPTSLYRDGARTVTTRYRLGPMSCHKTLSFIMNIRARSEAREKDALEGILFDRNGDPAECSASNLFMVKDGRVITPSLGSGILPGITRAEAIDICRDEKVPLEERSVLLDELRSADEVFLTNTLMGVMPVSGLDDVTYSSDRSLTTLISGKYNSRKQG